MRRSVKYLFCFASSLRLRSVLPRGPPWRFAPSLLCPSLCVVRLLRFASVPPAVSAVPIRYVSPLLRIVRVPYYLLFPRPALSIATFVLFPTVFLALPSPDPLLRSLAFSCLVPLYPSPLVLSPSFSSSLLHLSVLFSLTPLFEQYQLVQRTPSLPGLSFHGWPQGNIRNFFHSLCIFLECTIISSSKNT